MARADSRLGSGSSSTSNSLPFWRSVDRPPSACVTRCAINPEGLVAQPTTWYRTSAEPAQPSSWSRACCCPVRLSPPRESSVRLSAVRATPLAPGLAVGTHPARGRGGHCSIRVGRRKDAGFAGPPGRAALRKRPAAHAAAGRDERAASAGRPRCAAVFGNGLFTSPAAVPILQRAMACQGCGSMRDDET